MQLAIKKYIDNPQQSGCLPTCAAIFFNLTNQFNSVSHKEFKNVIATSFPELLPLVTLFYNQPNTVHYKWNDGSWRRLPMEEGTSQGCPLSPLFASFVVAQLLEPIDGLLQQRTAERLAAGDTGNDDQGGISHLLSFVDDISSCVYLPNLHFLSCEQVSSRGASVGCFVNPHKTRVLTSCNGTFILPTLSTHNPPLTHSLSTSSASFSTTPYLTNKTAPDIELTTGFRLLGQPVGSATFSSDFFACQIDDVKKNITSLLDNITDQQTRLRLFSQCIIQKLPHPLLSADILFHLPTDDPNPPWEEWNGPLTSNIGSLIKSFSAHSSPPQISPQTYLSTPSYSVWPTRWWA